MKSMHAVSPLIPIVALAFAIVHIAFEHFNGGVKTHHFLARGDLPGFSNWFGVVILPLIATVLAVRVRSMQRTVGLGDLPHSIAASLLGSLFYGAVLAASFHFGASQVSQAVFIGLFLCALAFPVYRAEYILGFVVGMTITFRSVIPFLLALAFAAMSYAVRRTVLSIISMVRSRRA